MTETPTNEVPTIRDGFQDLLEKDNAEGLDPDTVRIGDDILIAIIETYMDFDIGKEIADLRVEHAHGQTVMRCTEIRLHGMEITLKGKYASEEMRLIV